MSSLGGDAGAEDALDRHLPFCLRKRWTLVIYDIRHRSVMYHQVYNVNEDNTMSALLASRTRCSSSASLGLADFSQVDMLGVRYEFVNFGAETILGTPH